jgi:POT family proton-dependent oligopeptide transporter
MSEPDAAAVPHLPEYDTRMAGHPVGLLVLFFTELWERFSYYGMRGILILYLTTQIRNGGLGLDVATAGAIYGLYTSMVYLAGLPGGWLADRVFGQRRAVLIGGVLIAAGHFSLALQSLATFYSGLGLIVAGTGLLKPNISAMVGQMYATDDDRRDAGFTFFYMGINFGALFGPLACGYLGEKIEWHYGFGAAGVGMVIGLVIYLAFGRVLGHAGLEPAGSHTPEEARRTRWTMLFGGSAIGVAALAVVLLVAGGVVSLVTVVQSFGVVLLLVSAAFFVALFSQHWTRDERNRLVVIVVLFLAAAIFWGGYEQAGSSLNLFAKNSTDLLLGGWEIPASWFQSVPAFYVLVLSVVFTVLWTVLGPRQPSSVAKFALGLVFLGAGFVVMVFAALRVADGGRVGPSWLLVTYFLHVTGEMCLSPIGLSAVTKLAPARVTSTMMGVWFLASSIGSLAAGLAGGLYETLPLPTLFGLSAVVAVLAGALLGLAVPWLRKLTVRTHPSPEVEQEFE